jgi:hypothetical protein
MLAIQTVGVVMGRGWSHSKAVVLKICSLSPCQLPSCVRRVESLRLPLRSVINLVNTNLPRTALQICMFHFNYNFTIIVPNAFNYLKNVTTWEQCSVEL